MSEDQKSFLYFAYGSNMLAMRLTAAGRAPSARFVTTGHVLGRCLAFDKVGEDGSGKCDIEPSSAAESRVHGVVFEIDEADRARLDRVEGLGKGYAAEIVAVVTPSLAVQALAYVATNKRVELQPYDWYKALVIEGAYEHGLPTEYIDWLEGVPAKQGPESQRSREAWALVEKARARRRLG